MTKKGEMSSCQFAELGCGQIAYIRPVTSDEAKEMFPTATGISKNTDLFVLHDAAGTPLMLTDTREAAYGSAIENDLEINSVQ